MVGGQDSDEHGLHLSCSGTAAREVQPELENLLRYVTNHSNEGVRRWAGVETLSATVFPRFVDP